MNTPISAAEALRTLDEELTGGLELIAAATSVAELDAAEVAMLGRKSRFSSVQRAVGSLSEEDRRTVGQRTNKVRDAFRAALAARRAELDVGREARLLEADRIDVTLPGRRLRPG